MMLAYISSMTQQIQRALRKEIEHIEGCKECYSTRDDGVIECKKGRRLKYRANRLCKLHPAKFIYNPPSITRPTPPSMCRG